MPYFEITGLPVSGDRKDFGVTINLELEKGRGLSVLSDQPSLAASLFDAITGTRPFAGEIILNGMRIDPMPPKKRSVSILGDIPGIIPNRTVRQNLELALKGRALNVGEDVFLVEQEIASGPLAGLADVNAGTLDDVERTILAAARILLAGCSLLLIVRLPVPGGGNPKTCGTWNPGNHLDALLELKNLLRRHSATWISLLTDHGCVNVLSDRLAFFSNDAVIQEGSLRECLRAPVSRLVADFLAFPRMNYRRVTVEQDGPFVILRSSRYGFRVSEFIKRAVISRVGEDVIAGIKPEDLNFRPYETGDPTVMNLAKVTRVDSIPGALVVRLDVEGDEWVSLVGQGRSVFTGQLVELRPDPDLIHLFHTFNGVSLLD